MEHSIQEAQIYVSPALQCVEMQQHTEEGATVAELSSPGCPRIKYIHKSRDINKTFCKEITTYILFTIF
jgi:hypothetical protein